MKKIKGILIDSESNTVKEVEFENSLTSYYDMIDCECVTTVLYDNRHDVILDDEGLLKSPIKGFFEISGVGEFAGNGVIVSFNADGEWGAHKLNVEEVKKRVKFFQLLNLNGNILKVYLS